MSREVLSDEQINAAFEEYRAGSLLEDVSEKYHVSDRTLRRMFKKRNLYKKSSKSNKVSFTFNEVNEKI